MSLESIDQNLQYYYVHKFAVSAVNLAKVAPFFFRGDTSMTYLLLKVQVFYYFYQAEEKAKVRKHQKFPLLAPLKSLW